MPNVQRPMSKVSVIKDVQLWTLDFGLNFLTACPSLTYAPSAPASCACQSTTEMPPAQDPAGTVLTPLSGDSDRRRSRLAPVVHQFRRHDLKCNQHASFGEYPISKWTVPAIPTPKCQCVAAVPHSHWQRAPAPPSLRPPANDLHSSR